MAQAPSPTNDHSTSATNVADTVVEFAKTIDKNKYNLIIIERDGCQIYVNPSVAFIRAMFATYDTRAFVCGVGCPLQEYYQFENSEDMAYCKEPGCPFWGNISCAMEG